MTMLTASSDYMFTGYGKSEYNFNLPLLHLNIPTLEFEIFKTIRYYGFSAFLIVNTNAIDS